MSLRGRVGRHTREGVPMSELAGRSTSISLQELHRFIGTKSLRVQEFEDQTFAFSNRD
jgi:hypothetical protein